MNSLLLLLLFFLPSVLSECIKWAECDKAMCFSKYATRDGLGLFDGKIAMGAKAPTVGLALRREQTTEGIEVTKVTIQVEISGMKDQDFAAIEVGNRIFVGCLKDKVLPADKMAFKAHSNEAKYDGKVLCCTITVAHLNYELVAVSSALPLAIISSSNGVSTSLPTDFSVAQILSAVKRRDEVTCDISSFRMETPQGEGVTPYFPLQDPWLGRCGFPNQAIQPLIKEGKFGNEWVHVPQCKDGKWHHEQREIKLKTPLFCVPRKKQSRISCAGHAPPTEILCGRECGPMHSSFFDCHKSTDMQVLDNSTTWRTVEKILCTNRGFVSLASGTYTPLSNEAKVQCRVKDPHKPFISSITFPREVAIILAVVIYLILFASLTIVFRIIFARWAARVELLGPIRPVGHSLSTRAMKNVNSNNMNNNNNESNRNTPSNRTNNTAQSARSTKR